MLFTAIYSKGESEALSYLNSDSSGTGDRWLMARLLPAVKGCDLDQRKSSLQSYGITRSECQVCNGPENRENRYFLSSWARKSNLSLLLHHLERSSLRGRVRTRWMHWWNRPAVSPKKIRLWRAMCWYLGIAVGMNKGHVVRRRELPPRPSRRRGVLSTKTKAVRSLIKEVCGYGLLQKTILTV